jgi:hypothetical protein
MTPYRRHFASKQLWVGLALAAIIFLPNIVWQILNGWPSLEFYAAATIYKNVPTPPLKGLMNQILLLNPFAFPVWCVGLLCLLLAKTWKQYRAIGWAYLFLLVLMLASKSSRPDRIAGIYPVLFAAGGAAIESFIASHRVPWLKGVSMAMVVAGGLILLPLSVPILPPESLARYGATLGLIPQLERGKTSQLPQWFADRFDWDSFVTTVSDIYHRLPREDRKRAVIFVPSYGHAGALEVYGPTLGLPRVICNHNSYYLWSAGHANAEVLLAIGPSQHDLKKIYAQVDSVGIITVTYGMSWRNNMRVYLARKPTTPFNDVWEKTKHYE